MHNDFLAGVISKYRSTGRTIITALIFSAHSTDFQRAADCSDRLRT